jgi:tRNA pseudouridine38-40 synthase
VRRILLTLEYDGSDFLGWQLQPGVRSVQGEVEAGLRKVTQQDIRVIGAGRTDAGVHARGQGAHFDTTSRLGPAGLRKALNAVLPEDLAVLAAREVPPGFHARHDAVSKLYVYRVLNRAAPSPERRRHTWHIRSRLDLDAVGRAAELLRGDHDFEAFRGAHGGAPEGEVTRRSLDRLEAVRAGDEVEFRAEGRSFLRYMVRNLAGTLVDVGLGRTRPDEVARILASRDRARAGPTAPAQGLCLVAVRYPVGTPSEAPADDANPQSAPGVGPDSADTGGA